MGLGGLIYSLNWWHIWLVEPAPTIIGGDRTKMMLMEVICGAGRVDLFFELVAHMVGGTRPYDYCGRSTQCYSTIDCR